MVILKISHKAVLEASFCIFFIKLYDMKIYAVHGANWVIHVDFINNIVKIIAVIISTALQQ